jgi:hypothetical protein
MWMREVGCVRMGLAAAVMLAGAAVSASAADCVVCGEPTEGGSAVVHENRAYPIHEYPCRATWNRAVAQGRLDGREGPLEPAGAWVQDLDTESARGILLAAGAERLRQDHAAAHVAGFEQPDTGRVLLDGEDITDLPPNERKVNTIFQSYALFPHLTVWDNIAFGLKVGEAAAREIKPRSTACWR